MFKSIQKKTAGFTEAPVQSIVEAADFLNQAVDGLRESGNQDELPRGLLSRATLYRHQKNFLKSWTDLDEAREIAEYGKMRLHLTDYHLEACRNIKSQLSAKSYRIIEDGEKLNLSKEEMEAKLREHLEEAEKLVEETGYHLRDGELEELRR